MNNQERKRLKQIVQDEKRKAASNRSILDYLESPAGRLTTHLFRDYADARRQRITAAGWSG